MLDKPSLNSISSILGWDHPVFEWPLKGNCYGYSHFEKVKISIPDNKQSNRIDRGILDNSTGAVYLDGGEFTADYIIVKCFLSNLVLSIHFVGTVLYNILRIVPLIFYCTITIFTQFLTQNDKSTNAFKAIFIDKMKVLGTELLRSIINIIRAPYYTIAIFFAQLYGLVDPWNGRKITACFEKAWNHHIPLDQSIWMICNMPNFKFKLIGDNSLYIPGCFQPVAFIEEGKVFNAAHIQKDDRTIFSQKPTGCFCQHLWKTQFAKILKTIFT